MIKKKTFSEVRLNKLQKNKIIFNKTQLIQTSYFNV